MLAVLQFDAVSVPRIERLLQEGRLTTLAQLRARGRWVELETPATHFAAATYATLYTGLGVAEHGMYYSFQWAPSEQRVRWRGSFPQPVTVWERLAAGGRRALVIDPYEMQPPRALLGTALSGWQFVNVMSLNRWSQPSEAGAELARLFGKPRRMEEVFGRPSVRSLLRLRRVLLDSTGRVAQAAVHLLRRESFDLLWANFLAAHLGGHMFWDLSQLDEDRLAPATRSVLGDTLDHVYEHVDRALGRIVAALPADADVIVTSPIGMDVNMSRVHLLPGMLETVLSSNGPAQSVRAESRAERFLWQLRGAVPTFVRAKVAEALHGPLTREVTMRLSSLGVDWSRTPAFLLPSDHFGQIRLNIRGRERDGILDPTDVESLVTKIRNGLLSFRDPDGGPAVVAVDRAVDVVRPGQRIELLPDLVVRWSDRPSAHVDHVTSSKHGRVGQPGSGSGRSGAHRPQAWALLVPASSVDVPSDSASIEDVARTVCEVLSVDATGLTGRPLLSRA